MGMSWAEHTVDIDAPIETSFAAIVDYESFPRWQDAVKSVEVLSRTPDGLGEKVKLFVDAKIREIDYVLLYSYTRPTEILWDFVEGNGMRDCDGVYTLEELGPERTRATYKLGADPELPVPGMILRRTHKQLVKRSVEDLKQEAERRHASGEGATTVAEQRAEESPAPQGDEPAGEEPAAAAPPATEWKPKAEREAASAGSARESSDVPPSAGRRRDAGSVHDAAGEVVGKAVATGKEVAEAAARAGMDAAGSVIGAGREAADGLIKRVNRKLGN